MSRPCSPAFHQFFLPRRERGETGQVSEIGLLFFGRGREEKSQHPAEKKNTHPYRSRRWLQRYIARARKREEGSSLPPSFLPRVSFLAQKGMKRRRRRIVPPGMVRKKRTGSTLNRKRIPSALMWYILHRMKCSSPSFPRHSCP